MKLFGKVLSGFSLMIIAGFAQASVIYDFSFSNLSTGSSFDDGTVLYFDDFNISFTYDDYVASSGLKPVAGPTQPTSLGYGVNYSGANPSSQWGFDDDGAAELSEWGMTFNGASFWIFFWHPEVLTDFIKTPGTYFGAVGGNAHIFNNGAYSDIGIQGSVSLTVTETTNVPEPSPFLMVLFGILGVVVTRQTKKPS